VADRRALAIVWRSSRGHEAAPSLPSPAVAPVTEQAG
jgi:hypothetical protein